MVESLQYKSFRDNIYLKAVHEGHIGAHVNSQLLHFSKHSGIYCKSAEEQRFWIDWCLWSHLFPKIDFPFKGLVQLPKETIVIPGLDLTAEEPIGKALEAAAQVQEEDSKDHSGDVDTASVQEPDGTAHGNHAVTRSIHQIDGTTDSVKKDAAPPMATGVKEKEAPTAEDGKKLDEKPEKKVENEVKERFHMKPERKIENETGEKVGKKLEKKHEKKGRLEVEKQVDKNAKNLIETIPQAKPTAIKTYAMAVSSKIKTTQDLEKDLVRSEIDQKLQKPINLSQANFTPLNDVATAAGLTYKAMKSDTLQSREAVPAQSSSKNSAGSIIFTISKAKAKRMKEEKINTHSSIVGDEWQDMLSSPQQTTKEKKPQDPQQLKVQDDKNTTIPNDTAGASSNEKIVTDVSPEELKNPSVNMSDGSHILQGCEEVAKEFGGNDSSNTKHQKMSKSDLKRDRKRRAKHASAMLDKFWKDDPSLSQPPTEETPAIPTPQQDKIVGERGSSENGVASVHESPMASKYASKETPDRRKHADEIVESISTPKRSVETVIVPEFSEDIKAKGTAKTSTMIQGGQKHSQTYNSLDLREGLSLGQATVSNARALSLNKPDATNPTREIANTDSSLGTADAEASGITRNIQIQANDATIPDTMETKAVDCVGLFNRLSDLEKFECIVRVYMHKFKGLCPEKKRRYNSRLTFIDGKAGRQFYKLSMEIIGRLHAIVADEIVYRRILEDLSLEISWEIWNMLSKPKEQMKKELRAAEIFFGWPPEFQDITAAIADQRKINFELVDTASALGFKFSHIGKDDTLASAIDPPAASGHDGKAVDLELTKSDDESPASESSQRLGFNDTAAATPKLIEHFAAESMIQFSVQNTGLQLLDLSRPIVELNKQIELSQNYGTGDPTESGNGEAVEMLGEVKATPENKDPTWSRSSYIFSTVGEN